MKKLTFAVSIISFLLLLEISLCLASQHIFALSHNGSLPNSIAQQQPMQSPGQDQSNDQNQSNNSDETVRVTGALDTSTGRIRVTAIDPSP